VFKILDWWRKLLWDLVQIPHKSMGFGFETKKKAPKLENGNFILDASTGPASWGRNSS